MVRHKPIEVAEHYIGLRKLLEETLQRLLQEASDVAADLNNLEQSVESIDLWELKIIIDRCCQEYGLEGADLGKQPSLPSKRERVYNYIDRLPKGTRFKLSETLVPFRYGGAAPLYSLFSHSPSLREVRSKDGVYFVKK